jgi:hypothetical protein
LEEALARGWENFVARTAGPLNLRFVIQPVVAAFLAIRAGLRDAHGGRPAFLWSVVTQSHSRASLLGEAIKDVSRVLILAVTLDLIYQLIVLRWVYPLELVFTASILAFVPYLLIRGPANRIARGLGQVKLGKQDEMR